MKTVYILMAHFPSDTIFDISKGILASTNKEIITLALNDYNDNLLRLRNMQRYADMNRTNCVFVDCEKEKKLAKMLLDYAKIDIYDLVRCVKYSIDEVSLVQ